MAKTTWRFQFVDINKSITINEAEAEWSGFAVIRAPKGTTEAMYIPRGNPDMIQAMFGYASADWPDLGEVLDFNNEYGLYISAPTADVIEYPNYYGGVYLTSKGVLPTYRLTNKKNPNYEVGIVPGKDSSIFDVKNSTITLDELPETETDPDTGNIKANSTQSQIQISGINPTIFAKTQYLDFDFSKKSTFRYRLDKAKGLIYPDSSSITEQSAASIVCGSFALQSDNTYTLWLGGSAGSQHGLVTVNTVNTLSDETNYGIPFINFASTTKYQTQGIYNYTLYKDTNTSWLDWPKVEELREAILNGGSVTFENPNAGEGESSTVKLTYDRPIKDLIHLVYDASDYTYALIVQPSQTENKTTIDISDITYDKYVYDEKFYYTLDNAPTPDSNLEAFSKTLTSNGNYCLKVSKTDTGVLKSVKVLQYTEVENEDDEDESVTYVWKDVTEDFNTDRILAFDTLDSSEDATVHHKIFRVVDDNLSIMTVDNEDDDLKLQENTLYNSFRMSAKEEDEEGEIHESGNLVGSLDELGEDENGSGNYWEELLPPGDSITFAEIYVIKTMDKDLDENGIFKGTRVDSSSTIVHGQRYTTYIVNQNIKNGKTGGDVSTNSIKKMYKKVIKNGLIEAAKPKYGDASLFMEFTGLDEVKAYLPSIRTMHYTSTIITPKNITEAEFNNTKKISVSYRLRGTAQYIQELQYKDNNLRKKYYACPIGAMGVMLMKIMEGYYGGVAPAWLNEGSVGGQLDDYLLRTPIKARWDFTDADTEILDQKGLNPILMDADDGIMAVSQRTTEQNAGDWSYLGHSMAFDLCKREIRDNVMKPQLMKKINSHYINLRQQQTDRILAKRTGGGNPIWSFAEAQVNDVNNDYTRAQRIFNIAVTVRVFPFSEKVKLSFSNLSQITTVTD